TSPSMPGKWWLMRPIDTPASALILRTETPSWPYFARQASVALTSSSRRASGGSRRDLGSADALDRFTGARAQEPEPAVNIFLIEIDTGEPAVAGVGVARVQHAPVVEQEHRARQQPAPMPQRLVLAQRVEARQRTVESPLLVRRQRKRRAIVVV